MTLESWSKRRLLVQIMAFALLIAIPLLNYYSGWNFLQGWYQSIGIGDLWIVSPLEGLESILVSRDVFGPLIVAMLIPVIIAALLGRVFCGWICPIHFLSDLCESIRRGFSNSTYPKERWRLFRSFLLVSLSLEILATLVLGAPLFVMLSPPGLIGRELMMLVFFGSVALEGVIILLVLALNIFSRRFFCRYLCPLGGLLALLSLKRKLQVDSIQTGCVSCKRCKRSCPFGLDAGEGEGASIYCCSCGTCIDSCPHNQLGFSINQRT